jgi:hypothetical protein
MRSDALLTRMLRDRLAEAFENETNDGPRLDLANHKPQRDRLVANVARHEWMEIGRWIEAQREDGLPRKAAVADAAGHFNVGEKKCEEALTYYGRAVLWVDQALKSDAGQAIGREWLERLYHSLSTHPEMKRVNADLVRALGLSH